MLELTKSSIVDGYLFFEVVASATPVESFDLTLWFDPNQIDLTFGLSVMGPIGWSVISNRIGTGALLAAIAVAVLGVLLLETINYIEHYGLSRQLLPSGHYERVLPRHSWNSNHVLGRIFLYELTRHSDHHFKSTRKYQVLRHFDESPQLPHGYPFSILMALVPPLWFAAMDKRVREIQALPQV